MLAHYIGMIRSRSVLVLSLVLLALIVLIYCPLSSYRPVLFLDAPYLYNNQVVQGGVTWEGLRFAFTDLYTSGNWHPVTWLSLMAGVEVYGVRSAWHLATNIALHGVTAMLLFLALRGLTSTLWPSFLCAALFAVHPLNVETVAWLPERKDLLVGFFWMLCLLAYRRHIFHPGRWGYLWLVFFFSLGLMSKPMMVTLPFALLLLDYWPLGRFRTPVGRANSSGAGNAWRTPVIEKIPLIALSLATIGINVVALSKGGMRPLSLASLIDRIPRIPVSYLRYVMKALWPCDLAFFYPQNQHLPVWQYGGAALLLIAVTCLILAVGRIRSFLFTGWLWFLGTLLPVIGLVQVNENAIANRYAYLPLIGLLIMAVWGVSAQMRISKHRRLAGGAGLLIIFVLALTSRVQLGHWRDMESLMRHDLAVTSDNWMARYNLGIFLAEAGRSGEAIGHYREAIRIKPEFTSPHNNLGILLTEQGNLAEALRVFDKALRVAPNDVDVINNYGSLLYHRGEFEAAAGYFRRAIALEPEEPSAHNNLGLVLLQRGRIDSALASFTHAFRLKPDYADALYHSGLALEILGRREEAFRSYRHVLQIDPGHALALQKTGRTFH